jgi:hypothetical protein
VVAGDGSAYSESDWKTLTLGVVAAFVYVALADDSKISAPELAAFTKQVPTSTLANCRIGRGILDRLARDGSSILDVVLQSARVAPKAPLALIVSVNDLVASAAHDEALLVKAALLDIANSTSLIGASLGTLEGRLKKQAAAREVVDTLAVDSAQLIEVLRRVLDAPGR